MNLNRATLLALVDTAEELGDPTRAYALANALRPLLLLHKNYPDAVKVYRMGIHAAITLGASDREVVMRQRLARAFFQLGQFDDATNQITRVLDNTRRRDDRCGEANGWKSLGVLYAQSGQFERAVECFSEAWDILHDLDNRAEGLLLTDLGAAEIELGELATAQEHLHRARDLLAGLSTPDTLNVARAENALGMVHIHTGEHQLAEEELRRALDVFTELGSDADRSCTHYELAELHGMQGDAAAAQRHRDTAANLLAGLSAVDRELEDGWDVNP